MDLNALLNTLLSGESLQSIGSLSGSSQEEVQSVLNAALPSLLGGALNQSQGRAMSGSLAPVSHFDTACAETPTASARVSCLICFSCLSCLIFMPIMVRSS